MLSIKPKEYYQEMFENYQELKTKTLLLVFDVGKRGLTKAPHIKGNDLLNRNELRNKLKSGLWFLSIDQLKLLSRDNNLDLMIRAQKILMKKKKW